MSRLSKHDTSGRDFLNSISLYNFLLCIYTLKNTEKMVLGKKDPLKLGVVRVQVRCSTKWVSC